MLTVITKFLPLSDRKNLRLVCWKWFDACSAYEKNEVFHIGIVCSDNFDDVLSTLVESPRKHFNLEFYHINFGRIPRIEFWRTCGPRILSLKFVDSKLPAEPPLAGILRYCSNIQILEFYFFNMTDMKKGLNIDVPSDIIYPGLQNTALRTLKIHFCDYKDNFSEFCFELLCTLFRIFPNISNFFLFEYDFGEDHLISAPFHQNPFASRKLLCYLARDQIEEIALNSQFLLFSELLNDVETLTK